MKSKVALIGLIGLALMALVFAGKPIGKQWEAASVDEIQSVTTGSPCAKKILLDANREGQEITRRDLDRVKGQCITVDQQAKAF
ncbi:hypothetical protein [Pseudomonas sp. PDM25]|uniref:hypothetical protein n=1 Tax=Pseudomonas sp. PDM25 TaxID=2854772 RepID=UPI001C463B78|nr:hypothetical protein [Pseudomonas sp. PDM25]MBV7514564.1 hypothetical protein [Pseudomonas sp. PDM25]